MAKFWIDFSGSIIIDEVNSKEEALKKFWEQLENKYQYVETDCIEEVSE